MATLRTPSPLPTIRHLPPVGQGIYVAAVVVLDAIRLRILGAKR
jgi:hypothetical protein